MGNAGLQLTWNLCDDQQGRALSREMFSLAQVKSTESERIQISGSGFLFIVEITVRSFQPFLNVVSGCDNRVFRGFILGDAGRDRL